MVMKLFHSALLFCLWTWEIVLLRGGQVFSHVWVAEMGEGSGPQGNTDTVFDHFVVPTDVRGSHLKVAVTAPGQSTPKLTRHLGSQGGDNHQPGDMIPLRC